jgi:hypothetical protein
LFVSIAASNSECTLDEEFRLDVLAAIGGDDKVYLETRSEARGVGLNTISSMLVALGSAGAFTALYRVIASYIGRNKERELVLEINGNKLSVKGHSLPEEKELLTLFAGNRGSDAKALGIENKHPLN